MGPGSFDLPSFFIVYTPIHGLLTMIFSILRCWDRDQFPTPCRVFVFFDPVLTVDDVRQYQPTVVITEVPPLLLPVSEIELAITKPSSTLLSA